MGKDTPGVVRPLLWPDLAKGLAILWIFLNHLSERLFGAPYIANPTAGWPALKDRLAQLQPLSGHGAWDPLYNVLRYVGWSGDQGVQLFLILSGLGLTLGLLGRQDGRSLPIGTFYRRRLGRIYPLWWGAHLLFALTSGVLGWGLSFTDPSFYLSLLGLRFTDGLFYYFSASWWYVGLLLQLYLVYPLLFALLHRLGPLRLLLLACALSLVFRLAGLLLLEGYLDPFQRGALFPARLPEFALGLCLGAWLHRAPEATDRALRHPAVLLLACFSYLLGTALSLSLVGMAAAPLLLGLGLLVLFYGVLAGRRLSWPLSPPLRFLGAHSYSLFLVHHPILRALCPLGLEASPLRTLAGAAAAFLVSLALALVLEKSVSGAVSLLSRWHRRLGVLRTALRLSYTTAISLCLLLLLELAVRRYDPQEALGWGERPSLMVDAELGWRLRPKATTHLRWERYDYVVTANAQGFPGPAYPVERSPGTLRVLVVGDAFSSAEGVDTEDAWPRLLERYLRRGDTSPPQVQNHAITGYGPDQYAAVVARHAPIYLPDAILVAMSVDDYQDALTPAAQFYNEIGFAQPSPDSIAGALRLPHLRAWLRSQVLADLREGLLRRPDPHHLFLGGVGALRRDAPIAGAVQVKRRLQEIQRTAESVSARVRVLLFPAAVQACRPAQLSYYPPGLRLDDAKVYDQELPQRRAAVIAAELGLPFDDLRLVLSGPPCRYHPHNTHITQDGHRAVAAHMAKMLTADATAPIGGARQR